VSIKAARGDQFFINRESVERYAEELLQIDAVASIAAERHHDAPERAVARNSAPERDMAPEVVVELAAAQPEQDQGAAIIERLRDENLNLRIDNRGKEQAINFLTAQVREKDQHLQDVSYRLGAAETRVAQLEAPKPHDGAPRQSVPKAVAAIVTPEPATPEPRRSVFGRLFG
jgi:hypothetical protein